MRKWWLTIGLCLRCLVLNWDQFKMRWKNASTSNTWATLGWFMLILIAHDITGRPLTIDAVEIERPKHPVLAQFNWITKNGYIYIYNYVKERLVMLGNFHESWRLSHLKCVNMSCNMYVYNHPGVARTPCKFHIAVLLQWPICGWHPVGYFRSSDQVLL